MPEQTTQSDDEVRKEFVAAFCEVAAFQGRFSYCLMSIRAVNPYIFQYFTTNDPYYFLLWNMIYGITIMIFARPCLRSLIPAQRFTFSLLGSLAFNYSSLLWFEWLRLYFEESRPYLVTFLGYLSGRILMVHLIAFLYHIDTRCTEPGNRPRRDSVFEAMYL